MRKLSKTYYLTITILLTFALASWDTKQKDRTGEILFKQNCANCHIGNKTTQFGPSIQNIRKDYGVEWAVTFVKKTDELIEKRNLNALYSVAVFYPVKHTRFPVLQSSALLKIFDYVDKLKYDSTQTKHRRVSPVLKQKYVDSIETKHKLL
jgi:hypothetical protein